FYIILHHSCILCMIRISLHTFCISELFSGDLELLAIKLEETSRSQQSILDHKVECLLQHLLDHVVE
ncbi:unnamed protein product, partial [Arabidopsis halleri]